MTSIGILEGVVVCSDTFEECLELEIEGEGPLKETAGCAGQRGDFFPRVP